MSTFFEMSILWIYFILVMGVSRIQSKSSPLTHLVDSLEMTTEFIVRDNDNPFDIPQSKELDLRRKGKTEGKDIWLWDLYCHLQPPRGPCFGQTMIRYFYDAQLDECRLFNYTGCKWHQNNFETLNECERRCKGANFMGVSENNLPTVCYLQPDSGLCLAFMTYYYYDVNEMQCKTFTFGGCGGNLNRFETRAACDEHCTMGVRTRAPTTTTTQPPPTVGKMAVTVYRAE